MDRKGGVLSLKKKKKRLDFFLVLFAPPAIASHCKAPAVRPNWNSGIME